VGCTRAAGAVGGVARGNNTSATEWELSYTYPLSKRTLTYVGYHQIDNDEQAGYNFNINPITGTTAAGFKPKGFVVGLVHFF
jgi:predicted porin